MFDYLHQCEAESRLTPGVSRDQFRLMKIEDSQPERRREVIVPLPAHRRDPRPQ
jgi:hypothetical protein